MTETPRTQISPSTSFTSVSGSTKPTESVRKRRLRLTETSGAHSNAVALQNQNAERIEVLENLRRDVRAAAHGEVERAERLLLRAHQRRDGTAEAEPHEGMVQREEPAHRFPAAGRVGGRHDLPVHRLEHQRHHGHGRRVRELHVAQHGLEVAVYDELRAVHHVAEDRAGEAVGVEKRQAGKHALVGVDQRNGRGRVI